MTRPERKVVPLPQLSQQPPCSGRRPALCAILCETFVTAFQTQGDWLHSRPHPELVKGRNMSLVSISTFTKPSLTSDKFPPATATAASLAAYTAGSLYPPQIAEFLSPRAAPPAPAADSLEGITYTEDLEDQLQKLPLLNELRHRQDASDWYETRPYAQYPEDKRVNSLTAGALRGPGKLALSPVVRAKNDESENYLFLHLGRGLCGHDGIVHGGLLATVLDEALGRIVMSLALCCSTTHRVYT